MTSWELALWTATGLTYSIFTVSDVRFLTILNMTWTQTTCFTHGNNPSTKQGDSRLPTSIYQRVEYTMPPCHASKIKICEDHGAVYPFWYAPTVQKSSLHVIAIWVDSLQRYHHFSSCCCCCKMFNAVYPEFIMIQCDYPTSSTGMNKEWLGCALLQANLWLQATRTVAACCDLDSMFDNWHKIMLSLTTVNTSTI